MHAAPYDVERKCDGPGRADMLQPEYQKDWQPNRSQ